MLGMGGICENLFGIIEEILDCDDYKPYTVLNVMIVIDRSSPDTESAPTLIANHRVCAMTPSLECNPEIKITARIFPKESDQSRKLSSQCLMTIRPSSNDFLSMRTMIAACECRWL